MAANNMSNVHVSPDVLFNFTIIAAGNLYIINYNEKLSMASPEAVVRRCSVKKVFLKLCRIHRKTPVWEPPLNKVAGL